MLPSVLKYEQIKNAKDILDLSKVKIPPPVNLDSHRGPKCSYCSGWGFTIWLTTKKAVRCPKCDYSGVEPFDFKSL